MKGIYFTTQYDPNVKNTNVYTLGIEKKIRKQISVFEDNGLHVTVFCPRPQNRTLDKVLRRLPIRYEKYAVDAEQVKNVDFLYIRKPLLIDYQMTDYLKTIKRINPKVKILMEIPTYPYDDEVKELKEYPFKLKDKLTRKNLKKYVDVILTYSMDKEIFGIPTIRLSNGIDYQELNKYSFGTEKDDCIHVIACACFNFYHGYDRAIAGLRDYVQRDNKKKVILDVVGDGGALPQYVKLVEEYGLQDYVRFHGQLDGEALAKVYDVADIGLDSMGRHRAGVFYNSSLKGKEYCAHGLLIVSGVETELDHEAEFPYYFRIPADDSPMNWNDVIEFYLQKTDDGKNSAEIKDQIKDFAKRKFDMSIVFQPVVDYVSKT